MTSKVGGRDTSVAKGSGLLLSRAELERENEELRQTNTRLTQGIEQLNALHKIGRLVATSLDLDEVLPRVVEAAIFITRAEEGSFMLLDEETNELCLRAQKGLGEKYAQGFRIKVEDSIAGEVVKTGKPRRLTSRDRILKVVTGYIVNSILYVPLVIEARIIGVLSVDNQTPERPFTEDDEHLLSVLADYTAIAIKNARLVKDLKGRAQILTSLHATGRSMLSPLALDQVLNQITESALEILKADVVVLYEYDEREDDVTVPPIFQGEVQKLKVLRDKEGIIPHKQSLVFKMVRSGEPFYAANAGVDWAEAGLINLPERTEGKEFINREGIVSSAGIPLISGDETVGVMFVNYRTWHSFIDEEREIIEIFANQAAMAIQNARLMWDKERRIWELAGLLNTSRVLTTSPIELKDVLHRIVENTRKVAGADYALVFPYDGKTGRFQDDLITTSGVPEGIALAIHAPRPDGATMQVMDSDSGIVIVTDGQDFEEYSFVERDPQSFLKQAGVQSLVGVRLQVGEEPMGVLWANFCAPRHFREDELQLLQLFANQAAIAIQNARLFGRAQRHVNELSVLNQIGREISYDPTLEIGEILNLIYQQTARLMDVGNFYIALYEEVSDLVSFKFAVGRERMQELGKDTWIDRKSGNGITEYVIRSKPAFDIEQMFDPPAL